MKPSAKFETGQLTVSAGVNEKMRGNVDFQEFIMTSFNRHIRGDWGTVCQEDQDCNDNALIHGDRLLSAYEIEQGSSKIWIITEWDRSVTTVLFPDEY